jgi:TolB protein
MGAPSPQWDPALSPSGHSLAFRGYYRPFAEGDYALYVLNLRRSTWRRVTPKGSIATGPSWSPDGRWIAFSTSGEGEIWKVRASGGTPVRLTHRHGVGDATPAWSPNGRLIAFARIPLHGHAQIWVMHPDGRGAHPLLADSRFSATSPAWSRDGRRIAFVAGNGNHSRIEVMSANGSHVREVTNPRLAAWNPVWLPHDTGIAFLGSDTGYGSGNIYVMRADGRGVHQITHWHGSMQTEQFAWTGARMLTGRC